MLGVEVKGIHDAGSLSVEDCPAVAQLDRQLAVFVLLLKVLHHFLLPEKLR